MTCSYLFGLAGYIVLSSITLITMLDTDLAIWAETGWAKTLSTIVQPFSGSRSVSSQFLIADARLHSHQFLTNVFLPGDSWQQDDHAPPSVTSRVLPPRKQTQRLQV